MPGHGSGTRQRRIKMERPLQLPIPQRTTLADAWYFLSLHKCMFHRWRINLRWIWDIQNWSCPQELLQHHKAPDQQPRTSTHANVRSNARRYQGCLRWP